MGVPPTPPEQDLRRKAARLVAAKCTLAARVDSFHESPDGKVTPPGPPRGDGEGGSWGWVVQERFGGCRRVFEGSWEGGFGGVGVFGGVWGVLRGGVEGV